jgi:hypothetical protein
MDFIVGPPFTSCKFDLIWVIIDRLTKSAHFVPVNTANKVQKYVEIYIACVLVNQIQEDMLRACVMKYLGSWDKNLSWAKFSYNNSYQESLKIALFEVLYGHRCRTPLNWIEPGDKMIFGPDLVEEAKTIVYHIQENLRAAKLCQESYANKRR